MCNSNKWPLSRVVQNSARCVMPVYIFCTKMNSTQIQVCLINHHSNSREEASRATRPRQNQRFALHEIIFDANKVKICALGWSEENT